MTPIQPIAEDKRDVSTISFGSGPQDFGYAVGVNGVTSIRSYWENGEMAPVAWFAVFIGDHLVSRVPARMVFVSYQPPGAMQ